MGNFLSCVWICKLFHIFRIHISSEFIFHMRTFLPRLSNVRNRIPNLISEDFNSNFLDGNIENITAYAWNLWENSIFLVGKSTQVFQMLNGQYWVFHKGKTTNIFKLQIWKNPMFHITMLYIWHSNFYISYQKTCIQIFITLT